MVVLFEGERLTTKEKKSSKKSLVIPLFELEYFLFVLLDQEITQKLYNLILTVIFISRRYNVYYDIWEKRYKTITFVL